MSQLTAVTEANFQAEVLDASIPVLVDFWADWCGPCHALAPVLDKLAADYAEQLSIVKVNVDEQQQLAGMAGIRSLPTMLLFVNGQPVEQIVGAQPEANIRAVIEQHVGAANESAPPANEAVSDALQGGGGDASIARLEAVLADDPDNLEAKLALAKIHVVEGRLDTAAEMLATLSEDDAKSDAALQVGAAHWLASAASDSAGEDSSQSRSAQLYQAGIAAAIAGDHDGAAEHWLELLASDRKFGDDAARVALLKLVDLLTPADPRVGQIRRRMMTLIY
ncbi:MAG: thioredoxin [Pseudomonadota bacterium]